MKKGIVFMMALGMAAGLTACGGSGGAAGGGQQAGSSQTGGEAAAPQGANQGESIHFTLAMVDNTSSNYYKGVSKIAECVSEATEGKITITIQAGGTLGGESDTLDMAIQGDLDIASCANSVLANYIPEMNILDQAFLWDSADQANYAVEHELGDLIQAKANAQGIHVIGYMESGFRDVFSTKPIQSMADFKGGENPCDAK